MITKAEAAAINDTAVLLPRDDSEPPTIELDDVAVPAYVRLDAQGCPVVSIGLITEGVDGASLLASPDGVRFELRVNYADTAVVTGVVPLVANQPVTVVAA